MNATLHHKVICLIMISARAYRNTQEYVNEVCPTRNQDFVLAPGGAFLRFMGYINFALQIPHFCGERSKIVFGIRLSHLRLK